MATRPWHVPQDGVSVHLIGDVHVGIPPAATHFKRMERVTQDVQTWLGAEHISAHVQLGDMTDGALGAEETQFAAWWNGLPLPGSKHLVIGNHDLIGVWPNGNPDLRTPTQVAAIYGMPAPSYTVELSTDLRLIVLAPCQNWQDANNAGYARLYLGPAELAFLDGALASTSKDCVIAFHAPLAETVGGDRTKYQTSYVDPIFQAQENAAILAVLADHANAKAWVSGHTHSPITAPDLVKPVTVGGHTLVAINGSAIAYNYLIYNVHDPIRTLLMTYLGDRIEVRFRDHGTGTWTGPTPSQKVISVNL